MDQAYPKRLIEVDLPIKRISAHARREKSIRHGHISTLHIWWARRPLAACRAVMCAALWPDPADPLCPEAFREVVQEQMGKWVNERLELLSPESFSRFVRLGKFPVRLKDNEELRGALLDFIADFANWDNSTREEYLETSRALTQAAHEALGGIPGTRPLVVDPFAGGGAIPLEALRVGADAFASDLNPVAVLLNKVVLEYIPKYGQQLADEVRKWGEWIKEEAEKELSEFYPSNELDIDAYTPSPPEIRKKGGVRWNLTGIAEETPIAYIWARTITCEGPGCGAEVPLMRSMWLARKSRRSVALRIVPSPHTPLPGGEGQERVSVLAGRNRRIPGTLLERARELRQQQTPAEEVLWACLRNRQLLGAKFRRQHNVGRYIADFYCHEARLIVEADGGVHEIRREEDRIRDEWARTNGFTVLRFRNREILNDTEQILTKIVDALPNAPPLPSPSGRGAGGEGRIAFQIIENPRPNEVGEGTVRRGSATCPCCGFTTPVASVRRQLRERRGGATDARLVAVVCTLEAERRAARLKKTEEMAEQGRFYRLPTKQDLSAVEKADEELESRKKAHTGLLSLVPDEPTPQGGGSGAGRAFSQRNYGMDRFEDLFMRRQALALVTLARLVREAGEKLSEEYKDGLAAAVQTHLGMAVDRAAEHTSSLCRWNPAGQKMQATFARQALPIVLDPCETNPLGGSVGSWENILECVIIPFETSLSLNQAGKIECVSATQHLLPDNAAQCFFTDPPYYDAVPYADLSDFFMVWLKRTLGDLHAGLFQGGLAPKEDECIVDEVKGKDRAYFETTMGQTMAEGRRILAPNGVGVVVFAHKSTSGWEAQLQAMIDAGWVVTGSWPIDTEMGSRLRAMNSAALASSVHLVCRPRENPDGSVQENVIGDWRDVLRGLPSRIHEWMPRLAEEGVVGADAIFSCLGPALEVFSRFSRVEKASGEQVTLREYLEHVWAAVAREALNMIFEGADATGFEEDARLTAMWLWTLTTGENGNGKADEEEGPAKASTGYVLEFDAARKIAQGLGAHLEQLRKLVEVKGETARLLPVSERTKFLFGKDDAAAPTQRRKKQPQMDLFKTLDEIEEEGGWGEKNAPHAGETVLDRLHQTMILFAAGRGEAIRRFLVEDGVGRDERFWRLAQALSALYPSATDEKRWVDGVLARKKGLGF